MPKYGGRAHEGPCVVGRLKCSNAATDAPLPYAGQVNTPANKGPGWLDPSRHPVVWRVRSPITLQTASLEGCEGA